MSSFSSPTEGARLAASAAAAAPAPAGPAAAKNKRRILEGEAAQNKKRKARKAPVPRSPSPSAEEESEEETMEEETEREQEEDHEPPPQPASKGATWVMQQAPNPAPFIRLDELKNKYKGEGGAVLDAWISYTRRLLALNEGQLSAARSVTWLSTGLEGAALAWFEQRHDNDPFLSVKDLYAEMRKRFQPIAASETALRELKTIKQGKSSVDDYLTRFRQLATSVPELGEKIKMSFFEDGLREDLQEKLDMATSPPASLEDMAAVAARLDGRSRRGAGSSSSAASAEIQGNSAPSLASLQAQLNALLSAQAAGPSRTQQPPPQQPARVAYDSRSSRGANKRAWEDQWKRVPGMTKELWDRRSQANQCRWCGSSEHRMYDCADRVNKKAPRLN